jgi:hypothetical protein
METMRLPTLALAAVLCAPTLDAQAVRYGSVTQTTSSACAPGAECPILALPGTVVTFCTGNFLGTASTAGMVVTSTSGPGFTGASGQIQIAGSNYQIQTVVSSTLLVLVPPGAGTQSNVTYSTLSGCQANPATTYTGANAGTSCPTTAQLTPATGGACVSASDNQGNAGGWFLPGIYYYYLAQPSSAGGKVTGPYPMSLGAGAGCPLGAYCASNYQTVQSWCSAAGAASVYITQPWTNVSTYNLSAVCPNLVFLGNGSLQPGSGQTLTIGTGFSCDPSRQCLDVSLGYVLWGSPPPFPVQATWFKTGSSIDPGASVNAALASYGTTGCGTIAITGQHSGSTGIAITNRIGCRLLMPTGPVAQGTVPGGLTGNSYWQYTGNGVPVTITGATRGGTEIDHVNLYCSGGTPTGGILIDGGQGFSIHDNYVSGCGNGLQLKATTVETQNVSVFKNVFESNLGDGITIGPPGGWTDFDYGYGAIDIKLNQFIQNGGYGVNARGGSANQIEALHFSNNNSTSNVSGEFILDGIVGLNIDGDILDAASGKYPLSLAQAGIVSNFNIAGGYELIASGNTYAINMPASYASLQGGFIDNPISPLVDVGSTYLGKPHGIDVLFRGFYLADWDLSNVFGTVCFESIITTGSNGQNGAPYCLSTIAGTGQNGTVNGSGTLTPGSSYSAPSTGAVSVDAPGVTITGVTTPATTGGSFLGGVTYWVAVSYVQYDGTETCTDANSTNICGISANSIAIPAGTNTNTVHVGWSQPPLAVAASVISYKIYTGTSPTAMKLAATVSAPSSSHTLTAPGTGAAPPGAVLGFSSWIGAGITKFNPPPTVPIAGCTLAQPEQGWWKKVVIQLLSATGTCAYTFPTPFVNTPGITVSSTISAGVASVSNTAVTLTLSSSTGTITLEGN